MRNTGRRHKPELPAGRPTGADPDARTERQRNEDARLRARFPRWTPAQRTTYANALHDYEDALDSAQNRKVRK